MQKKEYPIFDDNMSLKEMIRMIINVRLHNLEYNRMKTAKSLGIAYKTLLRKIRLYED